MPLRRVTTEVLFQATGATRTSLLVTTLTSNPETIIQEAIHKAKVCYGLDIRDIHFGKQFIN
jgi:hypothetical protein